MHEDWVFGSSEQLIWFSYCITGLKNKRQGAHYVAKLSDKPGYTSQLKITFFFQNKVFYQHLISIRLFNVLITCFVVSVSIWTSCSTSIIHIT
jgi:hypothetical protein